MRILAVYSVSISISYVFSALPDMCFAVEAYPVSRSGFCPSGYHASGNYCVSNNFKSGSAIEREGFCPSDYHASGNYCVANCNLSGKAIFRNGFCPSGYHASGKYCV